MEYSMKILSVGNSFSCNAHTYFPQIAKSTNHGLTLLNDYIGGCSFERHMKHADAFDKNPNDPEGCPYPFGESCNLSLRESLKLKKWDVVTIQQASHESFNAASYHPHADRLVNLIRKYSPQAEIVVHETWAYRDDHTFWGRQDMSTDIMYRGLSKAYRAFCAENHFRMIPCGDAFQKARLSKTWGRPTPPNQKTGAPAIRSLHAEDCFHANANGNYLLGCVWFEFFFNQDARTIPFVPDEISADDAKILRTIAHATVSKKA